MLGVTAEARLTSARQSGRNGRELWQRIGAANGPQRMDPRMQPQPPGGAVALSRKDVPPVLRDQPEPGGDRRDGREVVVHPVEESADRKAEQQRRAEVPFVHARAEQIDPRPERVAFEAKHLHP